MSRECDGLARSSRAPPAPAPPCTRHDKSPRQRSTAAPGPARGGSLPRGRRSPAHSRLCCGAALSHPHARAHGARRPAEARQQPCATGTSDISQRHAERHAERWPARTKPIKPDGTNLAGLDADYLNPATSTPSPLATVRSSGLNKITITPNCTSSTCTHAVCRTELTRHGV